MERLLSFLQVVLPLMLSSSHNVTVPSSSWSNPVSKVVVWPKVTNKVAIKVQCPDHQVKFILLMADSTVKGWVILRGKNSDTLSVFCKDAGDKQDYGGKVWKYPAGKLGPCRGNVGSTHTLVVKWTLEGMQLIRDEKIVISRTWGSNDGHCLKKTAFWRAQNYGSSAFSAEIVLGTWCRSTEKHAITSSSFLQVLLLLIV